MQNRRLAKKRYWKIAVFILLAVLASLPFCYRHFLPGKGPEEIKKAREIPLIYKMLLVKWFPFSDENELKEWEEKVFRGKVAYKVEKDGTLSYVKATSDSTASALYYKINMDAKTKNPIITWKWRVNKFPAKKLPESLKTTEEDDFAARVYVIFLAPFVLNSKVIEYMWTETVPAGTTGTSPYSKNIKLVVLRSGPGEGDGWCREERDILADYRKAFGKDPERNVGAIAFMTNTEHTLTSAESMYDEIKLGYKEDGFASERGTR
ncbi:MAG: DUF3047 domain-containing protein [Candidatus Omnitrophota bacterium]